MCDCMRFRLVSQLVSFCASPPVFVHSAIVFQETESVSSDKRITTFFRALTLKIHKISFKSCFYQVQHLTPHQYDIIWRDDMYIYIYGSVFEFWPHYWCCLRDEHHRNSARLFGTVAIDESARHMTHWVLKEFSPHTAAAVEQRTNTPKIIPCTIKIQAIRPICVQGVDQLSQRRTLLSMCNGPKKMWKPKERFLHSRTVSNFHCDERGTVFCLFIGPSAQHYGPQLNILIIGGVTIKFGTNDHDRRMTPNELGDPLIFHLWLLIFHSIFTCEMIH